MVTHLQPASKTKLAVAFLCLVALGGIALNPLGQTLPTGNAHAAPLNFALGSSWNPSVTCQPALVTVRNVLGSQVNSNGGATFAGGWNASIPDKRSINPPCTINAQPMFVEIHNVVLVDFSPADECGDPGYSPPVPSAYCDSTGTIEDQNDHTSGSNYYMVRIHIENDMNWKYHNIAGPDAPLGVAIDIQGFVYWDPGHLSDSWHSNSGWELHPFTAWRLSGPQPLTASFVSSPSNPFINGNVYFTATPTGGTLPYTYRWNFGDGSTGTGLSPTHAYASPRIYTVNMTVTDSVGSSSHAANSVTVSLPPPLIASYQFLPSTPMAGETITLTGSATGGQPSYSYTWQLGDGASTSGNPVSHSYTAPGNYIVILNVTDSAGHKSTSSETINVLSSPPPPLITNLEFTNPSGLNLSSQVAWDVWDGNVQVATGSPALLDTTRTYELNVFYQGYLVETRPFSPQPFISTTVYMYPHQSTTNGYIAFNSTINNFALLEQTSSNLWFTATSTNGASPLGHMIIAKVPKSPASIQEAGADYPFTFNSSNSVVIIETPTLSDWNLVFNSASQPPPTPPPSQPPTSQPQTRCLLCVNTHGSTYLLSLLALGAVMGLVATLLVMTVGARRRLRKTREKYSTRVFLQ